MYINMGDDSLESRVIARISVSSYFCELLEFHFSSQKIAFSKNQKF